MYSFEQFCTADQDCLLDRGGGGFPHRYCLHYPAIIAFQMHCRYKQDSLTPPHLFHFFLQFLETTLTDIYIYNYDIVVECF